MSLPEELIKEIQTHYAGGYLWVDKVNFKRRNQQIERLVAQGVSLDEIARRMKLTPRRVRQILKDKDKIIYSGIESGIEISKTSIR